MRADWISAACEGLELISGGLDCCAWNSDPWIADTFRIFEGMGEGEPLTNISVPVAGLEYVVPEMVMPGTPGVIATITEASTTLSVEVMREGKLLTNISVPVADQEYIVPEMVMPAAPGMME